MGRHSTKSEEKGKGKAPVITNSRKRKRARRSRARTDVSSDSDSSSSSTASSSGEDVKDGLDDPEDIEMKDDPNAESEDASTDTENSEEEDQVEDETQARKKVFADKSGTIPSELRDLHDPNSAAGFEEYYMRLVTSEFGDDLNTVRQSKDFGEKSLPMLVRALRQGINIFDPEEKRIAIGGGAGGG